MPIRFFANLRIESSEPSMATGTTGARTELSDALAGLAARARAITDVPLYAGFGISTPEQARARILAVIHAIPPGQVMGYGQVAMRAGLPGLLLATLVFFTLKEPARGMFDPAASRTGPPPPFVAVLRAIADGVSIELADVVSGQFDDEEASA